MVLLVLLHEDSSANIHFIVFQCSNINKNKTIITQICTVFVANIFMFCSTIISMLFLPFIGAVLFYQALLH